ncbi:MAG TPA: phosphoribosylamine--glycine ligase [Acidimicrobiales bacterium]|nr:phosphoribosylamine--glycine ligase [Acidimicrobiales bacterium]
MVVGSGAREHALAWALAKSAEVVVTPGNAGMSAQGLTCVTTPATELEADLFVIGPEQPLVDGLADALRDQGKLVVGPSSAGALLEGSKAYMKDFLASAQVPTADFGVFEASAAALAFLDTMSPPYVIKTDGLAAGKGVLVTNDFEEACRDVSAKLSGAAFGAAGTKIVIEEALEGTECSLLVLCDGVHLHALVPAQDFKRVGDADSGANTGGMGAFAPLELSSDEVATIMSDVLEPTLEELRRRGIDYRGVLYAGVMRTPKGPKLLEYNVRFGDPETQVLAPLYGEGLYALLHGVATATLDEVRVAAKGAAVTVVLAASGYPQDPRRGDVISGLGADGQLGELREDVVIFHAGTARDEDGTWRTNGGRVLAVTGLGANVEEARHRAYEAAALVSFEGCVWRRDIAQVAK